MIVLGHKGYSAKYPENTLLSFKKAIEYGADGVELDVWLTKDGKVVVHHDPNIVETYGADLYIKESTLEELKKYEFEGEKIPTLDEVYATLPDNATINVEIKDIDASIPALNIVREHNAVARTIISSFDDRALKKVRKEEPNIRIGLLISRIYRKYELIQLMRKLKPHYINVPIQGSEVLGKTTFVLYLKSIKLMRKGIIMWTVNDPKEFEPYYNMCDGVITDEVELMIKNREAHQ